MAVGDQGGPSVSDLALVQFGTKGSVHQEFTKDPIKAVNWLTFCETSHGPHHAILNKCLGQMVKLVGYFKPFAPAPEVWQEPWVVILQDLSQLGIADSVLQVQ